MNNVSPVSIRFAPGPKGSYTASLYPDGRVCVKTGGSDEVPLFSFTSFFDERERLAFFANIGMLTASLGDKVDVGGADSRGRPGFIFGPYEMSIFDDAVNEGLTPDAAMSYAIISSGVAGPSNLSQGVLEALSESGIVSGITYSDKFKSDPKRNRGTFGYYTSADIYALLRLRFGEEVAKRLIGLFGKGIESQIRSLSFLGLDPEIFSGTLELASTEELYALSQIHGGPEELIRYSGLLATIISETSPEEAVRANVICAKVEKSTADDWRLPADAFDFLPDCEKYSSTLVNAFGILAKNRAFCFALAVAYLKGSFENFRSTIDRLENYAYENENHRPISSRGMELLALAYMDHVHDMEDFSVNEVLSLSGMYLNVPEEKEG